ncbi:MAG: cellulose synthase operon protein YhjQ/BcsQ [Anaeromyxobacteraceae bacterium]
MSPDVQELLRVVRVPGFRYRELQAGARAPARQRSAEPRRELTVALVSLVPRVGRTTLAANLAAALARRGLSTVAVDLDPGDALRLHLGGGAGEPPAPGAPGCVAFGAPAAAILDALDAEPAAFVLDTPAGLSRALEQALGSADEVLVVLRADRASLDALPAAEALLARTRLRSWRRLRTRYVVNAYDARRHGEREALARFRADLGARLWPIPVQADEAVRAALAARRTVLAEAPDSQVVADLAALAADLTRTGAA